MKFAQNKPEENSLNKQKRLLDLTWMIYEEDWGPEAFIREARMRGAEAEEIQKIMLKFGSSELLRKSSLSEEILLW